MRHACTRPVPEGGAHVILGNQPQLRMLAIYITDIMFVLSKSAESEVVIEILKNNDIVLPK